MRYLALEQFDVIDPKTMQPVPWDGNTLGEVMFRGNVVMKGYFKKPEAASAEAFAGGWFHSGDLGVIHPDGYVQLKDRSKDIIISGGENISSIEVEDTLFRHPAVAMAAVVAMPHKKWGKRPVLISSLPMGPAQRLMSCVTGANRNWLAYKVPGKFVFAPSLKPQPARCRNLFCANRF